MAGLSVWNGAAFVDGEPRIWNGMAFVPPSSCHVWDGAQFVKVWPSGIEFVSSATANSNTVAMPAHQAGDFLVCFTTRNSFNLPSLASGWTNIDTGTATSTSARIAYKVAASSSESTGTWTSANSCTVHVYRGVGAYRSHSKVAATDQHWPGLTGLDEDDAIVRCMVNSSSTPGGLPGNFTARHQFGSVRTCDRIPLDGTSQQSDPSGLVGANAVVAFTVALRT